MDRKKVVVAMSGGVDSSVAAALLKEEGHEVLGLTMNLFSLPEKICHSEELRSCCGWRAQEDANRVAIHLSIPHFVADFRQEFERKVIQDFCQEYSRGRTPNPCIRCNQYIKFDWLLERAKILKADYIATGHYARVEYDSGRRRYLLKKGKDREKDQSYFLYPLTQDMLALTFFPVGSLTKREVRKRAKGLGLPVAEKPESQEICFVPNNDYAEFLRTRIPEAFRPGLIVDLNNKVLGEHQGIVHFTVGQRRGMKIAAPHPLYVISIDGEKNTVVVGENRDLYKSCLLASDLNFIALKELIEPIMARVKIRYKHTETKARITPLGNGKARIQFERPQRAITPGQAVVFYDRDVVIGGGTIDRVLD